MPSINVDLFYFEHPKTKRLVRRLGKGAEVLPIKMWAYCGKYHKRDGRLTGYTTDEIRTDVCGYWGDGQELIDALLAEGFLDRDAEGLFVHDWLEHASHLTAYEERARKGGQAAASKRRGDDASSSASSTSSSDASSSASSSAHSNSLHSSAFHSNAMHSSSGQPPNGGGEELAIAREWLRREGVREEELGLYQGIAHFPGGPLEAVAIAVGNANAQPPPKDRLAYVTHCLSDLPKLRLKPRAQKAKPPAPPSEEDIVDAERAKIDAFLARVPERDMQIHRQAVEASLPPDRRTESLIQLGIYKRLTKPANGKHP